MGKIQLRETVKYKDGVYLTGSVIEVDEADMQELSRFGSIVEPLQVRPVEEEKPKAIKKPKRKATPKKDVKE